MSSKVKNQHYIPQMYLKRFAESESLVNVWKKDGNVILTSQSTKGYAARRYFYDVSKEILYRELDEMIKKYPLIAQAIEEDEQLVEHMFGKSEASAAKALREIEANSEMLYDEDIQATIVKFLYELAFRTEAFRASLDCINEQTLKFLEEMGISQEDAKKHMQQGVYTQMYKLLNIKTELNKIEKLLYNYKWYIGTVKGEMKLVVSDDVAWGIRYGFNDICIPISDSQAIILRIANEKYSLVSNDQPEGNRIELSANSVLIYNLLQMSHANRFMFGNKKSLEVICGINKAINI